MGSSLAFSLKEDPVRCAKVCDKSWVILKDIGVGGLENGNFPLLYVVKMSLRRWVGGSEKLQNTLT